MSETHYNISIVVTKVEHKMVTTGEYRDKVTSEKRVVTEAGKVEIKSTDFNVAKDLASKHLELLTEFTGTDPKHGATR
jgi:hypothetical protein